MPRTTALKPEQVPADSKPTLDAFTKNIGFTPNMMARPEAAKREADPLGLDPTRYGDWALKGIAVDF